MWAPDVYDGSPTPVSGFMATGVKAAAFAALARVLMEAFPTATYVWQPIVAGLAIASMVVGNLVALAQRSLKRMLAYSSIAHAGYLLVAVWPGTPTGAGAVLLYLLAYGLTTLASFGFLAVLGRGGERDVTSTTSRVSPPAGPGVAFGLSVCMLSLLGFPGTVGFIGKWYILTAVVAQDHAFLAVDPGAHQRGVRGLLPAGHHGHVHEAGARARAPAGHPLWPRRGRRGRGGGRGGAACSGSGPSRCSTSPAQPGRTLTQTALPLAGR